MAEGGRADKSNKGDNIQNLGKNRFQNGSQKNTGWDGWEKQRRYLEKAFVFVTEKKRN